MTQAQAARIASAVQENLTEDDGESLIHIEVKEMADGFGSWGVFATTVDVANSETLYRTVVDRAGDLVGPESEVLR